MFMGGLSSEHTQFRSKGLFILVQIHWLSPAVKNDKSLTDAVYIIYNTFFCNDPSGYFSLSINFIVQNNISALKK